MLKMFLPIGVVVGANCFYNICAKSTPADSNAYLSLVVTYGVAMIISFVAFMLQRNTDGIVTELSRLNWTAIVLGVSIVALEAGYIWIYRAGWQVNTAPMVANICLAVALMVIGYLVYKEAITVQKILGLLVCAVGLVLLTK